MKILVVDDDGNALSDKSALGKAKVKAKVLGETAGDKIDIFKYKNKSGYRRRQGHRQKYTRIEITGIEIPGAAGGLRDSLRIDPQQFTQCATVYVVLERTVAQACFFTFFLVCHEKRKVFVQAQTRDFEAALQRVPSPLMRHAGQYTSAPQRSIG